MDTFCLWAPVFTSLVLLPCNPELRLLRDEWCDVFVVALGVSLFELLQLTSWRDIVTLLVANREDVDIGATLSS